MRYSFGHCITSSRPISSMHSSHMLTMEIQFLFQHTTLSLFIVVMKSLHGIGLLASPRRLMPEKNKKTGFEICIDHMYM